MGLDIQGDALNNAFARFKELADRKVQLSDADLEALVAEEVGSSIENSYELVTIDVKGGNANTPTAEVILNSDGTQIDAASEGDGMVDAACTAIKKATGIEGRLTDYTVTSVTGGVDALADVALSFESTDGLKVSGRGLSTDVVEASARAFISALNKVIRVRNTGENPQAVYRPGHIV